MRAATSGAMLELFRMSLRPPGLRGRHASKKARDEFAGFLLKRRWKRRSANGATGGRGCRGPLGRPCRPRCQDAELMRSDCGGESRRLLPDISGSQHAKLHRRDRKALRFIGRQLRRKAGGGARNREDSGRNGQVRLLHFNSPGYDSNSNPQSIPPLLHCDITILHRNNAISRRQLMVRAQSVSKRACHVCRGL